MANEDPDAYYISKITSIITNDPARDLSETLDTLSNEWVNDADVIKRFKEYNERNYEFDKIVKDVIANEENKIRPLNNNRGGGTKKQRTRKQRTRKQRTRKQRTKKQRTRKQRTRKQRTRKQR